MDTQESAANGTTEAGLTTAQAHDKLRQFGPNKVSEEERRPLLNFCAKFWAPVPWMLEATIAMEILVRKYDEAIIIGVLLVFNSILSFLQENHANRALILLRSRLSVRARVLRDARWQLIPAQELVPGDVIHLRLGDLAPADVRLSEGAAEADESELTGESLPVEKQAGAVVYAGSRIKRGEATGQVTAIGKHTYFGKTAELVKTATTKSQLQEIIFTIVKYLVAVDGFLVVALLLYAGFARLAWADVLPFALILLVASVPVALPTTFTVATALGALEMSRQSVLVTRLSAIEEAAAMDVLCTDKTGTITQNQLSLEQLCPTDGRGSQELLRLAALASDPATQDPLDLAIVDAARSQGALEPVPRRTQFVPFDPVTKRSEAIYEEASGILRVVKGAPGAVIQMVHESVGTLAGDADRLAADGARVLAVAAGDATSLRIIGLLTFKDQIRNDSKALIESLSRLGVRVIMVTGDAAATARAVATQIGIGERVCTAQMLHEEAARAAEHCDVFAGVFPEDKFRLVESLQRQGHVTGMTGDGVNDAPALKQAEVGVAVSTATDVAKAAASLVLTESGLSGVLAAVETGRRIYQRMLTYTLNKIMKTFEIGIFLSVGLMLSGAFVVTPLLVVLLLFTNDFVTMSIATDYVAASPAPDRWDIRKLMLTASALAGLVLVLSFTVFFVGRDFLHLPLAELQTLVFLLLVFTGQGNVYLVRERGHFWHSRPSRWLILSSVADIVVVSLLAAGGILMRPVPLALIVSLLLVVAVFLALIDSVKICIFRYFQIR
ncbi:MAG TPA: plasma-membrane proton-efflux P-type ATPase [Candidatus Acidoferrales bacterium]|nr:plasma-membrane proton-efflux P-type ATPase [Candidatus Acidoferrales bacterium]